MVYINTYKGYQGYNHALGKYIRSKRHYEEEMKAQGAIPYEQAQEIVRNREEKRKQYSTSADAHAILEACKPHTDKDGNVKMPDRAVDALKKMGTTFERGLPEKYRNLDVEQGGFNA